MSMRKYDIPYVPNTNTHPFPAKSLQEMTLDEIIKKHIKTCAKANGKVDVCSKCKTPCKEGERAIQLTCNLVYNDPPIPLYGGKTLIENAREENLRRREEKEKTENMSSLEKAILEAQKKEKKQKRSYIRGDEWWEESLKHGDQVDYLVTVLGFTKQKAKKAIYSYRSRHGLAGQKPGLAVKTSAVKVDITPIQKETVEKPEVASKHEAKNDVLLSTMELKMSELMDLQAEYKANIQKYTKLYEEVKEKVDTLCKAMDIFN